jgi:hypothetical protein
MHIQQASPRPGYPGAPIAVTAAAQPMRSQQIGCINPDTTPFNDYESVVRPRGGIARIAEIRCVHDRKSVFGIEAIYEFPNGERVSGGMHVGKQMTPEATNNAIVLANGEQIKDVTARAGSWIHYLRIVTTSGRVLECGGPGGSPCNIYITNWQKTVGLAGGIGGHLHNLSLYLV